MNIINALVPDDDIALCQIVQRMVSDEQCKDQTSWIQSKWGAAPIILISGYDPAAVALTAEKPCVSDFPEKPFSREIKICNTVKKAIGGLPAVAESNISATAKDASPTCAVSSTGIVTYLRRFPSFGKRARS
jgi:DNA-binding NtrC family response regulator